MTGPLGVLLSLAVLSANTLKVTLVLIRIMVFRRNRMALRPINRIKHVFDFQATIALATAGTFPLAIATDTPTLGSTNSVETGSKINGFYIRFEASSNNDFSDGATPNFYFYLWKNTGGNLTAPPANAVGSNDNKRYVIHQEMTMLENKGKGSNARTVFNGVIAVPKGMRRMGPNDEWNIVTVCPQLATAQCVQCHYKEFR